MRPISIVMWFRVAYRRLGLDGCSSHSGRRTFITNAARLVHKAGGSLRDVQVLAGHSSIQTTQRYIDGDSDAQRKLVSLIVTMSHANSALTHAVRITQNVCQLAGPFDLLDFVRQELRRHGILAAVRHHDTPAIYDWLMSVMSFQGIANRVAEGYLDRHGNVTWADIDASLVQAAGLPKAWRLLAVRPVPLWQGLRQLQHAEAFAVLPLADASVAQRPLEPDGLQLVLVHARRRRRRFRGWVDRQLDVAGSPRRDPAPSPLARLG